LDDLHAIALAAGLSWASGVRLYAMLFCLGILHAGGVYTLPENLQVISHPVVMSVSGLLFFLEFFADKIPAVDTLWDAVHTFIRIPAGALLAAAAAANADPGLALAAGLLGGIITAGTHFTKAGGRALLNTSPEPVTNWIASLSEDAAVFLGLIAALKFPLLFLTLLAIFLAVAAWLIPKIWRGLHRVFGAVRRLPIPPT
jgi:hypothetical protein